MILDWEWIENLSPTMQTVLGVITFTTLGLLIIASVVESIKEKKRSSKK